ncbi:hypothetical protein [Nesterenkonia sp. HG001]|uniref:hypothetical protein n=1 Tax=Nesterenkonia sp. HG001 TaxID=2983207 RepID=UPI002AC7DEE4|nr:hypothetical protein [Nesterenkonia sp. HG001]MDZ5077870.1 hypothetical protein [Nesterenkonia sp. HG001]
MATTRYRNKTTGKIATYSRMIPRLEKSKSWERVTEAKAEPKAQAKAESKTRDKAGGKSGG